jgi:hypothetical protein
MFSFRLQVERQALKRHILRSVFAQGADHVKKTEKVANLEISSQRTKDLESSYEYFESIKLTHRYERYYALI